MKNMKFQKLKWSKPIDIRNGCSNLISQINSNIRIIVNDRILSFYILECVAIGKENYYEVHVSRIDEKSLFNYSWHVIPDSKHDFFTFSTKKLAKRYAQMLFKHTIYKLYFEPKFIREDKICGH